MKQKIIFGPGNLYKVKPILKKEGSRRIFLVTGGNSFTTCGAKNKLDILLKKNEVYIFNDFEVNPKIGDIKRGIAKYRKFKPDLMMAVGGGSVIDVAKTVNVLSANQGKPELFITGKKSVTKTGKTLIALPTTAGSGSESTHFAVVYIDKTKYSLAYPFILPTIAIIDPELTYKTPQKLTAASGMDALAQSIESYWSVNSTPLSKRYSSAAIKLILGNFVDAVNRPTQKSRIAMSKAANLAGQAINIAKTTACHSISYPLTSYFGIPHGHAVGLTLSSMMKYNAAVTKTDVTDKRGAPYVKRIIKKLGLTPQTIEKLMKTIGLETRLGKLGITSKKDINIILDHGFNPDRVKNNPRLLTREALERILVNLM